MGLDKTNRRANVAPRHGVPVADGQEPVEAHEVDGDANVAQVGQPEGDEVVTDDLQLRGRVQDGDAQQEEEAVRVAQLQGDEARVVRVYNGRRGRVGRDLLFYEPIRRYKGCHCPGNPICSWYSSQPLSPVSRIIRPGQERLVLPAPGRWMDAGGAHRRKAYSEIGSMIVKTTLGNAGN